MKSPKIVYEDNHYVVIEKPPNWLVQSDKTGDSTLLDWARAYIKEKYNKPSRVFCHPCHRLDRPVGGIVIFGKTSKGLERMNQLFNLGKVEKKYWAEVTQIPEKTEGTLVHWLEKNPNKNKVTAYERPKNNAKKSTLIYKVIATSGKNALLEIRPLTGRPHQIRIQLQKINCPIKGDLKYGAPSPNHDKSISLHCYQMQFMHPIKKEHLVLTSRPDWPEYKNFIL